MDETDAGLAKLLKPDADSTTWTKTEASLAKMGGNICRIGEMDGNGGRIGGTGRKREQISEYI